MFPCVHEIAPSSDPLTISALNDVVLGLFFQILDFSLVHEIAIGDEVRVSGLPMKFDSHCHHSLVDPRLQVMEHLASDVHHAEYLLAQHHPSYDTLNRRSDQAR